MPRSPEINDKKHLEAWLESRPLEDSVVIAHRAAMRVLPVWYTLMTNDLARSADISALNVVRANLITEIAYKDTTSEIARVAEISWRITAVKASENIPADASIAARATSAYAGAASYAAIIVKSSSANADFIARDSAKTASFAALAIEAASYAAAETTSSTDYYIAHKYIWNAISADIQRLIDGTDPFTYPLWTGNENPLSDKWGASKSVLRQLPGGEFWIDWYQRALDGRPQNWPMLRDVALIEDEIWKQGGEALNQRITEIRIDYAIAATPNGEKIEPHPETGQLQLAPDTELPDDLATYIRRKIIDTVEIFDDIPNGNQYSALQPDLTMLRKAAKRKDNSPVDLFDACKGALNRLARRIKSGDCPSAEHDAIIADYRDRLIESVADIPANDAKTRDVLDNRSKLIGNNALIEDREKVLAGIEAFIPLTTGYLAEALPEDAELATSPDAPKEERSAASYRLVSRILRIGKYLTDKIIDVVVEKTTEIIITALIVVALGYLGIG